jgi:hypothetical protein
MATVHRLSIFLNFKNFGNRIPAAQALGVPAFAVCYGATS